MRRFLSAPHGAACAPVSPCPACGRRLRRRRTVSVPAPLPLFIWATRRLASPSAKVRLVMLHNCRDVAGEPMPALMLPGSHVPMVFRTVSAALDAQRRAEGWA